MSSHVDQTRQQLWVYLPAERSEKEEKVRGSEKTESGRRGKQEGGDPEEVARRGRRGRGEQSAAEVGDAAKSRQLRRECRRRRVVLVIFH